MVASVILIPCSASARASSSVKFQTPPTVAPVIRIRFGARALIALKSAYGRR